MNCLASTAILFTNIPIIYCIVEDLINTRNSYYLFFFQSGEHEATVPFDKASTEEIFDLTYINKFDFFQKISFKSLSLYDYEYSEIIAKWEDVSLIQEEDNYHLLRDFEEVHKEINKAIKKLEIWKKLELKIQVNSEIEEFIFLEVTRNRNTITYSNLPFINRKMAILNTFPDQVLLRDYELTFFWTSFNIAFDDIFVSEPRLEVSDGCIESIRREVKNNYFACLFFLQNKKEIAKFTFKDFDLSLCLGEEDDQTKYASFFKATKKIKNLKFGLFVDYKKENKNETKILQFELKQAENALTEDSYEVKPRITETIKSRVLKYKMFKIIYKPKSIKIILRRPKEDINNDCMKSVDSLTIKCFSWGLIRKPVEVKVNAKETITKDYIETIFSLNKTEEEIKDEYVLQNALKNKTGYFEISINGEKGTIGTYGISLQMKDTYFAVYSSQLLSIPFPPCNSKLKTLRKIPEIKDISTKVTIICITILSALFITKGFLLIVFRYY